MLVLRRPTGWIRSWHGGQLVTLWAGAVLIPWRIAAWREPLIRHRLEGFLDPGRSPGPAVRVAEVLVYYVLPLVAVALTAVWVGGKVRRTPLPRG